MNNDRFLDDLFSNARATEPYIPNDNFTLSVMASIPAAPAMSVWTERAITAIFAIIGALLAYAVFPTDLIPALSLPSSFSFSINIVTVLASLAAATLLSIGSWWYVEKRDQFDLTF